MGQVVAWVWIGGDWWVWIVEIGGFLGGWHGGYVFFFIVVVVVVVVVVAGVRGKGMFF